MKTEVKIAEFKGKLSEYLRSVRQGNEVVIKDRDTPIAKLIPYQEPKSRLIVRGPTGSLKDIDKMLSKLKRPKGLKPGDADRALKWVNRDVFDKGLV
jgi:prevent-host-death family protein